MGDRRSAAVLLAADPPEHRRQRHAVDHAFRPARIVAMEPMVQEVSDRLLDAFADRSSVEFVGEYGVLLPMEIIARALGVGAEGLLTFKRWSDDMAMPVGNMAPTVEEVRSFLISTKEFGDHFGEVLDQRMAEPRDDVISDIANAAVDGEPLTRAEQLSMCQQFLVAGNETTTKLLTNIAHYLAITPGARGADPRRPVAGRLAGGGGAPVERAGPGHLPPPPPRTPRSTASMSSPGPTSGWSTRRRTATRPNTAVRTSCSSTDRTSAVIWRSGTASTSASARRSHASKPASPSTGCSIG